MHFLGGHVGFIKSELIKKKSWLESLVYSWLQTDFF
jgi:predicted alpha/beta-fold hydrolase